MTVRGLRFIHSSDWHLERPLLGLAEVPEHLREMLLDAAYRAATRIFDLAISENVDFLLLAGDILNPTMAGPRALVFLSEQFERLAAHKIRVYWAMGPAELMDDALAHHNWPANLHLFTHTQAEQIDHQRDGQTVARVIGRGYAPHHDLHPADFHPDPSNLPTVVVAYAGQERLIGWPVTLNIAPEPGSVASGRFVDQQGISRIAHTSHELSHPHENGVSHFSPAEPVAAGTALSRIDYWALGGRHRCDVAHDYVAAAVPVSKSIGFQNALDAKPTSNRRATSPAVNLPLGQADQLPYRFCGTPQGREHDETGPHGCLLASIADGGRLRSQFFPTDELRWTDLPCAAGEFRSSDELEVALRQKLETLRIEQRGVASLVRVTLTGSGRLIQTARRSDLLSQVAHRLRTQFGHGTPTIWTTAIELESLPPSAEAAKEDSLLGDFLRLVQRHELGEEAPLNLDHYVSDRHRLSGLHDALIVDDPQQLRRILHEAAHLGAELLTGHRPEEETKA